MVKPDLQKLQDKKGFYFSAYPCKMYSLQVRLGTIYMTVVSQSVIHLFKVLSMLWANGHLYWHGQNSKYYLFI